MKKLLSMIGVISIAGAGTSSVIGCSDSTSQSDLSDAGGIVIGAGATLQPTSQAVAAKITQKKNITLSLTQISVLNTNDKNTQTVILKALQQYNTKLTDKDLTYFAVQKNVALTYDQKHSPAGSKTYAQTPIKLTINASGKAAEVDISVRVGYFSTPYEKDEGDPGPYFVKAIGNRVYTSSSSYEQSQNAVIYTSDDFKTVTAAKFNDGFTVDRFKSYMAYENNWYILYGQSISGGGGYIAVSKDGITFNVLNKAFDVASNGFEYLNGEYVFYGRNGCLFFTNDDFTNKLSGTKINLSDPGGEATYFIQFYNDKYYISQGENVYYSSTLSATKDDWTKISDLDSKLSLKMTFFNNTYLIYVSNSTSSEVYESSTGTTGWTKLNFAFTKFGADYSLDFLTINKDLLFININGGAYFATNPTDPATFKFLSLKADNEPTITSYYLQNKQLMLLTDSGLYIYNNFTDFSNPGAGPFFVSQYYAENEFPQSGAFEIRSLAKTTEHIILATEFGIYQTIL